jgi:hypothetical protein
MYPILYVNKECLLYVPYTVIRSALSLGHEVRFYLSPLYLCLALRFYIFLHHILFTHLLSNTVPSLFQILYKDGVNLFELHLPPLLQLLLK